MNSPTKNHSLFSVAFLCWLVAACVPVAARQEPVPVATNQPSNVQEQSAVSAGRSEQVPEMYFRHHQEYPVFFNDYVVERGATNYGDAVTFKGTSTINGTLTGSSITFFGDAKITGDLGSMLLVIMGSARLGPEAHVGRDVVVLGGKLTREPGATIGGDVLEIDPERVPGLPGAINWVMQGFLLGRPLPFGVGWAWMVAGALLLVNLIAMLIFPGSVQRSLATIEARPASTFFSGILALLLCGLLGALLIVSVVGIIVLPFLAAAMIGAFVFGKIAVYRFVGQQLGNQVGIKSLAAPAIALLLGTAVIYLLYAVPFLGFVGWSFTSIFGVGAATMAAVQKLRGEQKSRPVTKVTPPTVPVPADAKAISSADDVRGLVESPSAPDSALETSLLPNAGFWIRLGALGLDLVLFLMLTAIIPLLQHPGFFVVVWGIYHVALWTWRGSTIGGLILKVKVVTKDGRQVDLISAVIRALASVFSATALGLGFFWAGFRYDKRSWHDMISGTVLVKAG